MNIEYYKRKQDELKIIYYNMIISTLENMYNSNNHIIYRNKGTLLELVACIILKCVMYSFVDFIDFDYKPKYYMSRRDDGIDLIDMINKKIYQVKFYSKNKILSNNNLGSFFAYLHNLLDKGFKSCLVHSQDIKLSKHQIKDLTYKEIKDDEILNIIHKSYDYYFKDLKNKTLLNDLYDEINKLFGCILVNEYYDMENYYNIKQNILNNLPKKDKIKIKVLYKHQTELLDIMNNTTKKDNYYQLACGTGKSYIIQKFSVECDKRVLILVPNILLAEQYKNIFNNDFGIDINECWTDTNKDFDEDNKIYVCVYDSYEYLKDINFDYIIVDEAHHILKCLNLNKVNEINNDDENEDINNEENEDEYNIEDDNKFIDENGDNKNNNITNQEIYNYINNKECIKYYFSATLDINKEFDYNYSIDDAIKDNIINDFIIDIHQVQEINDLNIIKSLKLHPEYKRILIYCSEVKIIQRLTELFNKNGIRSKYLYAGMKKEERLDILKDLKNGLLRVVFSVNTICEGIDVPNVDTCYFYNNKESLIQIMQCLGRIMRKSEDKLISHLLFFTDDINDNINDNNKYIFKILNKINKYSNRLMNIKCYNEEVFKYIHYINDNYNEEEENYNEDFNDEEIETNIKENIINKFIPNDEMKIKLCQEFYNEFKRLPKLYEEYNYWKIGRFIDCLKNKNNILKQNIENIFNCKIKHTRICIYNIRNIKYEKILNTMIEFMNKIIIPEYNKKKRNNKDKPKKNPPDIYNNINITNIYKSIKRGCYKKLKEPLEKAGYNFVHKKNNNPTSEEWKEIFMNYKDVDCKGIFKKPTTEYKEYKYKNFKVNLHLKYKNLNYDNSDINLKKELINNGIIFNKNINKNKSIISFNAKKIIFEEFIKKEHKLPKNKNKININNYNISNEIKKEFRNNEYSISSMYVTIRKKINNERKSDNEIKELKEISNITTKYNIQANPNYDLTKDAEEQFKNNIYNILPYQKIDKKLNRFKEYLIIIDDYLSNNQLPTSRNIKNIYNIKYLNLKNNKIDINELFKRIFSSNFQNIHKNELHKIEEILNKYGYTLYTDNHILN